MTRQTSFQGSALYPSRSALRRAWRRCRITLGLCLCAWFATSTLVAHATTNITVPTTQTGGTYTINPADDLDIDGTNASLTLQSSATSSGVQSVTIGDSQSGALTVQSGSIFSNSGSGTIGNTGTSSGIVLVSGTGSQWNNTQDISIGVDGSGTLKILGGGYVSNATSYLGAQSDGLGIATITGSSSLWSTQQIYVGGDSLGSQGTGELTIVNAGQVSVTGQVQVWSSGQINVVSGGMLSASSIVTAGSIVDDGLISSPVEVLLGGQLSGHGTVGVISGSGQVSPGDSPGIMTTSQVNPGDSMSFAFELTQTGDPNWNDSASSDNDVLRITDDASPFIAPLTDGVDGNEVDVYFDVDTLSGGNLFRGGFYTDLNSDFLADISDANYKFFVEGDGGGSNIFNGVNYYDLASYNPHLFVTVSTSQVASADFQSGTVSGGWVTQFLIGPAAVPEPSALVLAALGLLSLGFVAWRRRAAADHQRD